MEDSVSIFMTNTFLRKPQTDMRPKHLSRGIFHVVKCGSSSEFYIIPPLSCVNDHDTLVYVPFTMAFSGYTIVLPDMFECLDEKFSCFHIENYENYPGFVQLRFAGDMVYNWDIEKYEFSTATEPIFISGDFLLQQIKELKDEYEYRGRIKSQIKGPALKEIMTTGVFDRVYCICCPKWPHEAKEWPTRKRQGEWPSPAIIQVVVRNGYHIVHAQHRDCRDDEFQFRFSFSLAEVILLRVWTTTQQLIYHMLRFFAKRELIQEDCPKEKEVLCTYHLKTLMLWTCEKESAKWWKSSSVIVMCCKLLRELLQWIEKRHCRNYFIPEANLFSGKIDPVIAKSIADQLQIFSDFPNLSEWFVSNYLLQCYKNLSRKLIGEFHIGRLYSTYLRNKRQEQLQIFDDRFTAIVCACMTGIWQFSETRIPNEVKVSAHENKEQFISVRKNLVLRSEIPFIYLDRALLMLYAANALSCKQVLNYNDFVSDVVIVLSLGTDNPTDWRRYHNFPKNYRERPQKVTICFVIAQENMGKLCTPGSDPEFHRVCRLSMEYLKRTYINKDISNGAFRNAAVAYMAAICFATSQFQTAIDLCFTIFQKTPIIVTSQIPQREEEPLNAGCLMFIDDVSNCIGFVALFQYIINKLRPDYRQYTLNLRLTPQVFAEYLMIQSAERMSKQVRMYWNEVPAVSLIDSLFIKVVKRKLSNKSIVRCASRLCVYRQHDEVEEVFDRVTGFSLNEDISIRLLMECTLESTASLYQKIFDPYGVQCHTVVNCYRALYYFKLCQYDNVLNLCDKILANPQLEDHLNKLSRPQSIFRNTRPNLFAFPHVLALRPFSAYFDEDVQCLIGLQVLCHVFFPECEDQAFQRYTFDVRMGERHEVRNQFDMTFHLLLTRKSVMLQYFLGRHFLARYLKLRCFLSCDKRSVTEIFDAVHKLKPLLPMEHVIYQFLLRKLQRNFS